MTGAFDEALDRFAACGPEFGGGLSNHGPMAAEALVAMGREDAVRPWSEWYERHLAPPPRGVERIRGDDWREALGDPRRSADWADFFHRELHEAGWRSIIETWAPRLLPGLMAGATHGLLRTAHAVRALERAENDTRIHELGYGLAHWAARYQELPSAQTAPGRLRVRDALAHIPRADAPPGTSALIFERVKHVASTDFGPVINLTDVNVDLDAFISDVTAAFAPVYLANARAAGIGFVHTVTAPSSLRFLAPYLPPEQLPAAMRYVWQACAAIYAAYARAPLPEVPASVVVDPSDLVDQAVAARDEHAIKFTEACLREHARSGAPALLLAAQDAVVRLRRG